MHVLVYLVLIHDDLRDVKVVREHGFSCFHCVEAVNDDALMPGSEDACLQESVRGLRRSRRRPGNACRHGMPQEKIILDRYNENHSYVNVYIIYTYDMRYNDVRRTPSPHLKELVARPG